MNIRKQTGIVLRNLSILLYGQPKIGKTTQAAKFPNALLLNCEPGGTDMLAGEHNIVDVRSLDQLDALVQEIAASEYKTIIVDGFTWLINQAVRERSRRFTGKDRRRIYADVTDQVSRIMGDLLSANKLVIATGHSRAVDVDDEPMPGEPPKPRPDSRSGKEEEEKIEIRPDLNPRLADSIFGLFSIIAYCFTGSDGSKMLTKPMDNAKRRILAGDRSGVLPQIMPLDAKLLQDALKAAAAKEVAPTAAE